MVSGGFILLHKIGFYLCQPTKFVLPHKAVRPAPSGELHWRHVTDRKLLRNEAQKPKGRW